MTKSMKSYLIFDDYSISNMEYKRNFAYNTDENSEITLEFDINGNAELSKEKDKATLTLNVTIFEKDFQENNAPFF